MNETHVNTGRMICLTDQEILKILFIIHCVLGNDTKFGDGDTLPHTRTSTWSPIKDQDFVLLPIHAGLMVLRGGIRSEKSILLKSGGKVLMFMLAFKMTGRQTSQMTNHCIFQEKSTSN